MADESLARARRIRAGHSHVPRAAVEMPLWPALPEPMAAIYLSLLHSLERSQWWPAERHEAWQFRQLEQLLSHAARTVPFYRERLGASGFRPGDRLDRLSWRALPILERSEIQAAGASMHCEQLPEGHGGVQPISTSGSTGAPIKVLKTELALVYWRAFVLRERLWAGNDFSGRSAIIHRDRSGKPITALGNTFEQWGEPISIVFRTGPAAVLESKFDIPVQAEFLLRERPNVLSTWPTVLRALAEHFRDNFLALPSLRHVHTFGEIVDPSLRALCRKVWRVEVFDSYTAEDPGYMAIQCPEHEHYHVQSEAALVEIVDENGRPCAPGEIGRVVVTPLHNFAMPLIRYDIGDYAEVGEPCPCGRGLPVLTRILGRRRNLLRLPGGRRQWASVRSDVLSNLGLVARYQVAQIALDRLEVRMVAQRQLTADEETQFCDELRRLLGHPFAIAVRYVDDLPRVGQGKFEDFRCEIPA